MYTQRDERAVGVVREGEAHAGRQAARVGRRLEERDAEPLEVLRQLSAERVAPDHRRLAAVCRAAAAGRTQR
jgi:hypothetical protein